MSDPNAPKPPQSPWRFASAGFEIGGAVAALSLFGYWIDTKLDSSPWGILIGAGIGIIGGLYNLVRSSLRMTMNPPRQQDDRPDKPDADGG